MGFEFTFRELGDAGDLDKLTCFLIKQDLGYPGYRRWVERAKAEIEAEYKTAGLAFSSGTLVGDILWQPHKQFPKVRELKNLRVHPSVSHRCVAKFLLRQAEVTNPGERYAIICDASAERIDVHRLLMSEGYDVLAEQDLYGRGIERIYLKKFDRTPEGLFVPVRNKFINN